MGRDAGIIYPLRDLGTGGTEYGPVPKHAPGESSPRTYGIPFTHSGIKPSAATAEEFEFQVSLYQNGLVPTVTLQGHRLPLEMMASRSSPS